MNDPTYTRAVFVRDPKERFVSAFLDKAVHTPYFYRMCCSHKKPHLNRVTYRDEGKNFTGFVEKTLECIDTHWGPQS
jgi:hypothetical protein